MHIMSHLKKCLSLIDGDEEEKYKVKHAECGEDNDIRNLRNCWEEKGERKGGGAGYECAWDRQQGVALHCVWRLNQRQQHGWDD